MKEETLAGLVATFGTPDHKPESHIAIVVPSVRLREEIQRAIDPDKRRFRVIRSHDEVRGMRFNMVLVTDAAQRHAFNMGRTARDRLDYWLQGDVTSRLIDGGRIVNLC